MANKCNGCGLCCRLFYINLTKEEYESNLYKTQFKDVCEIKNFKEAQGCGANLLAKKEDGSCVYLVDNLCGIHKIRPTACRNFFCTTRAKKFEPMVEIIKDADSQKISSIYEDKS